MPRAHPKKRHGTGSGTLSRGLLDQNPRGHDRRELRRRAPGNRRQVHDSRQFEALYDSLDPDNVLECAILDKGYDANRIRERLAYDGIEPVIPPSNLRCGKLPYDKTRYRQRNRVERFFSKLKQFRRLATRYDKLQKTFLAAIHLVCAFLSTKNS